MLYQILRPLLFKLDAELSHNLTLKAWRCLNNLRIAELFGREYHQPKVVMGIDFPNPLGIAAGLDKNGEYIDALAALGVGFIEVGTVTPKPQPGNKKPRLFRLPEHQAIINRFGFNSRGIDYLIKHVKQQQYQGVLGINIGKNASTPNERALEDYLYCLRRAYPYADYIAINLSSPNTRGLRDLQYGQSLRQLLSEIKEVQVHIAAKSFRYVPLAVKVSPDLDDEAIAAIAEQLLACDIDGLIACNTTIDRNDVKSSPFAHEAGGLSGTPLTNKSTMVVQRFHQHLQDKIPIIATGGIMSAGDAKAKLQAGAELLQVYSGLIYQGPRLIKDILQALEDADDAITS